MDAASTASAPPAVSPSYRWSSVPTPPEAITGIPTRSAMVRVNRMSYPSRVPSRSMLVSRISPAPYRSIRAAHSTASIPVGVRPPWVYTSHSPGRSGTARASIATTVHWLPNPSAPLSAVPGGDPPGAPRVPQGDEPDALHHAAVLHVQARYDALGKHVRGITSFPSSGRRQARWSRRRSHDRSPLRTPRRLPYP